MDEQERIKMDREERIKRVFDFLGGQFYEQIEVALSKRSEEPLKKLETAKTIEEYLEIFYEAPVGRSEGRDLEGQALEKIEHLISQKLEVAKTTDECLKIYHEAPGCNGAERQALAKAISLASTIKEWKECFGLSKSNSGEAYACIRAIAALLSVSSVPVT